VTTLPPATCRAIAATLRDIDAARGTLWGRVTWYDPSTGVRLPAQRRELYYSGWCRSDLPADWGDLLADKRWIRWNPHGTGGIPHWVVTDAGRAFADRWPPATPIDPIP